MTDDAPLADRGPDEPHPARLPPDHPERARILATHREARVAGDATYTDPVSGYLVLTSAELARRGACCGQGCRHCPWLV